MEKDTTQLLVLYASVCPVEENPLLPFTGPKQSPCCSGLLCEKTDRQSFDYLWVISSGPPVLCNLPMNHITGLQTAQQAPTGELMMFFATMVSVFTQQTVNNIPGCHYCLQYNKIRKSASVLSCLFV